MPWKESVTLLMSYPCLSSALFLWPSPSPSAADAMLHPDPSTMCKVEPGGPLVTPFSAPRTPHAPLLPLRHTRQDVLPVPQPLPVPHSPCMAQPRGHHVPWQCGLAESWCNSSAPFEGKNLLHCAPQPPPPPFPQWGLGYSSNYRTQVNESLIN